MPQNYQIKKYIIFSELSTVPKEFAENIHYDIYNDNGISNEAYCRVLMSKIFKLPYRLLPDFITHVPLSIAMGYILGDYNYA